MQGGGRQPSADGPDHARALGGAPVAVWFDPASRSANAFDCRLEGRRLSFRSLGRGVFEDRATGDRYNMDGECVAGPGKGRRLRPVFGLMAEWYGWFAHHPGTTVWPE